MPPVSARGFARNCSNVRIAASFFSFAASTAARRVPCLLTAGAAYPIVSKQGTLLAAVLAAKEKNDAAMRTFEQLRAKPRALTGGMRYLDSPRHAFYVQFEEYLKVLENVRKRVERAAH